MMESAAGKRTNSLAFAQTDCHTCATLGDRCDRRRPRCSPCLSQSRQCGGFATALSWDPKRMLSSNPDSTIHEDTERFSTQADVTLDSVLRSNLRITSQSSASPVRFRFVGDHVRSSKRRKTRSGQVDRVSRRQSTLQEEEIEPPANPIRVLECESLDMTSNHQAREDLDELGVGDIPLLEDIYKDESLIPPVFDSAQWLNFDTETFHSESTDPMPLSTTPLPVTNGVGGPEAEGKLQDCSQVRDFAPHASNVTPVEVLHGGETTLPGTSPCVPTATAILDFPFSDNTWLFEMYDTEFCVLPLTSDVAINPFRCKLPSTQGPSLLFHAVLALCYRHLSRLTCNWSDEATQHHGKAVHLLENALRTKKSASNLHLLEPILILFTLDCTLSATGCWPIHFKRAHTLLQACGGPNALTSQQARSQVAMLLWWDSTAALISRTRPVLDRSYLEYLVWWEKQDKWSFFDLTGCPRDLLVVLYNLSELAQQSEIGTSMRWLTFDIAPVVEAEKQLSQWHNDLDPQFQEIHADLSDASAEKEMHKWQDRYHCAEAWRYALLLYIQSVFKRNCPKWSFSTAQLTRKTLDHIRCCRQTSQTQKQLLLPIFIAGSETSDPEMRGFVKAFCSYWGDKSGYNMFNSVPSLLEEIWSTGKRWTTVIDTITRSGSSILEPSLTQVLLG